MIRDTAAAMLEPPLSRVWEVHRMTKIVEDLKAKLIECIKEPTPEKVARRADYNNAMRVHATIKQRAATALLDLLGTRAYLDDEEILLALDNSALDYPRDGTTVQTTGMMDRLGHVPEYIEDMGQIASDAIAELRKQYKGRLSKIKVYGVGGSATPAGMAREIIENSGLLGFDFEVVRRDEPWFKAVDNETLLIFASFSGNTEETINCLDLAVKSRRAKGRMIAMSTDGLLEKKAKRRGIPWIPIPKRVLQPRESLALQLIALLRVISDLKFPSGTPGVDPYRLEDKTLRAAGKIIRDLHAKVWWKQPFARNKAKQFAAKLVFGERGKVSEPGWRPRVPIVLSSASTQAVAYEFYSQLCEASKIICHVATYPEALHNLVESMKFSRASGRGAPWSLYYIENKRDDERRVRDRWDYTLSEVFGDVAPCRFETIGKTPLERSLSAYYFNAWLRLYIAFLNGAEPLPVPTMDHMKEFMKGIKRSPSARDC
jgi:hypothetical protein